MGEDEERIDGYFRFCKEEFHKMLKFVEEDTRKNSDWRETISFKEQLAICACARQRILKNHSQSDDQTISYMQTKGFLCALAHFLKLGSNFFVRLSTAVCASLYNIKSILPNLLS
uniref:Uncharacterized protein n=1 Tax=Homalodisca liturata TaxID=320908 RepID=A0A1B6III3_9HEMI